MKKITAMAAAVVAFVLIFSGCNTLIKERVTAYSLVKNAMEKTGGLKDAEMKLTEEIHAQATGITLDVPLVYDLKVRDFNGENPVGMGEMSMQALAQKSKVEFCFDKDFFYVNQGGVKLKFKKDSQEAALYMDYDPDKLLKMLPEETLEGVTVLLNEDGSRTVSTDLSEEAFSALYKEITEDMEDKAANNILGENGISMDLSEFHVDITVLENGYLGLYSVSFSGDMTLDGEATLADGPVTIHYKMKATLEFIDPGKEVQLTLPADLDEYLESDEYYEKYPYGPDWVLNEETGKFDYVGDDGEYQYDEEKEDWYYELEDGERIYFNEDEAWSERADWVFYVGTGKFTYVGEDEKWQYDEEKEDWYVEWKNGDRFYFNEERDYPYEGDDWLYNEEADTFTYIGEDGIWQYDEKVGDWYCQQPDGLRLYFYYHEELFYNGELGQYLYIGEDEDWHFDEEELTWYRGDREAWFS